MFKKHDLEYLKSKAGINNGYLRVYYPEHPNAYSNGCVFYHRLVVENKLGRYLEYEEFVHHINENKLDNSEANLEVTTNSEHAHQHNQKLSPIMCLVCGEVFIPEKSTRKYCSYFCSNNRPRKKHKGDSLIVWPVKEELEKLVWEMPTKQLAKQLGVSDSAIGKRCKKLEIKKPPRGYWMKKRSLAYNKVDRQGNVWPTKEELENLVWTKPLKCIAAEIGVCSETVAYKCKKYNISLPPNSYWKRKDTRNYNGP